MNAEEFVTCWKKEKEDLLKGYLDKSEESYVSQKIKSLKLNLNQEVVMKEIIDGILTDTFYTLLLGLDGEASIGGVQQTYKIYDEDGNLISDCGEIEEEAYEQFHGEHND